jgi:hypothetical protein
MVSPISHQDLEDKMLEIETWVDNAPDPITFHTNDEFMAFIVELMNRCLYLLKLGVTLVPTDETSNKGYVKQKAVLVGHMVRIVKLYEGMLIHTSRRQLELATIFTRLIFESTMRLKYLIKSKSKRKAVRSFIVASYKPEKEMLTDLKGKASKRPLIQIEKRIRRKVKARAKGDGISLKELMGNKVWNMDGKDFRRILQDIGVDGIYSYGFGNGSHAIHGDWLNISAYDVEREGHYYTPKLQYTTPDPRLTCPMTTLCLGILLDYLIWNKSDPYKIVAPTISNLLNLNRAVDAAHENSLGE